MHSQGSTNMAIPQGDGADMPFPIHLLGMDTETATVRRAMATVGDLLRAVDRQVLRDVIPASERVMASVGIIVKPEDWTGGRVRFATEEERDKAWKRLSGLVALAIANADSIDARVHWRLLASFIRYLALLEYQNAVTALNNQRDLGLSVEQVTAASNDVVFFGRYCGVLS